MIVISRVGANFQPLGRYAGEPLLAKRKIPVEFCGMKVISALLLVCLSGYAATTQMEVEKRVPLTLAHLAQLKQKDPQAMVPVRSANGDVVAQISKIVLDAERQRPKFAVLSLFDNVTQNAPQIVVPWETL